MERNCWFLSKINPIYLWCPPRYLRCLGQIKTLIYFYRFFWFRKAARRHCMQHIFSITEDFLKRSWSDLQRTNFLFHDRVNMGCRYLFDLSFLWVKPLLAIKNFPTSFVCVKVENMTQSFIGPQFSSQGRKRNQISMSLYTFCSGFHGCKVSLPTL